MSEKKTETKGNREKMKEKKKKAENDHRRRKIEENFPNDSSATHSRTK